MPSDSACSRPAASGVAFQATAAAMSATRERRRSPAAESDDEQRDRQCRVAKSRDVLAQPRRHEIGDRDRDGVRGQEVPQNACALHPPRGSEAEDAEAERHGRLGGGKRIAACAGEQPQEHELGCAGGEQGRARGQQRSAAGSGETGQRRRARPSRSTSARGLAASVSRVSTAKRQRWPDCKAHSASSAKRESERERKPCRDQEAGPHDRKAAARPAGA